MYVSGYVSVANIFGNRFNFNEIMDIVSNPVDLLHTAFDDISKAYL